MASTSDEERENESVGPPSALFKATLTFPVRDRLASDNTSEVVPTDFHRRRFASGHESPLLEGAAIDDGWEDLPAVAKAEGSTMPAPNGEHLGAPMTLELSSSLLESDRDTALAYASLHGSLVPTPLPADLAALDTSWAERDTVRPPAVPERTAGIGPAVEPAAPELVAELALVAERARKAEAALADAHDAAAQAAQRTKTTMPPPRRSLLRRILFPVIVSNVAVAVAVGVLARVTVRKPLVLQTARVGEVSRSPLAPGDAFDVPAPAQSCAPAGASRVLAARAQLGPGIDVTPARLRLCGGPRVRHDGDGGPSRRGLRPARRGACAEPCARRRSSARRRSPRRGRARRPHRQRRGPHDRRDAAVPHHRAGRRRLRLARHDVANAVDASAAHRRARARAASPRRRPDGRRSSRGSRASARTSIARPAPARMRSPRARGPSGRRQRRSRASVPRASATAARSS